MDSPEVAPDWAEVVPDWAEVVPDWAEVAAVSPRYFPGTGLAAAVAFVVGTWVAAVATVQAGHLDTWVPTPASVTATGTRCSSTEVAATPRLQHCTSASVTTPEPGPLSAQASARPQSPHAYHRQNSNHYHCLYYSPPSIPPLR